MIVNILLASSIALLVGAAGIYIYREKKKGKACIGCPYGGCCSCNGNCQSKGACCK